MDKPLCSEDDVELRCKGTLHGIFKWRKGIRCEEKKCHHIACTKGKVVVYHYFDLMTGELVDTQTYQDIGRRFR